MELRHLRYFVAVAEELHFGRAAERLRLAQPPLSQQIRQLEIEMGVALLHRTTRKVTLTEAGKLFLLDARQILNQLDQAKRSARRAHNGESGRLVVAFLSSSADDATPALLKIYRTRFPDVQLILHEMENSFDSLIALNSASVHASILRPPVDDHELCHQVIYRESFVVALPEAHHLTRRNRIGLADLASEPFVAFQRRSGTTLYDGIIAECQKLGFGPKIVAEQTGTTGIVCLVAAGIGISILPASAALRRTTGVVYRDLRAPSLIAETALAWRKDDDSPALRSLVQVAQDMRPRQLSHYKSTVRSRAKERA